MLPGVSGYDLSHEIRTLSSDIPIIFLSAKIQTEDIVKGFKSGGNDYLKKPFSIDELLVRIESLLTRFNTNNPVSTSPKDIYYFGNCSLDTVRHILTTSKGQFNLSYKETMLLEKLLLNTNKVVQRGMLLQQIWGNDDHYTSRSMDVHLTRIRKLITNEKNINIMNLRGIGYKLLLNTTESQ
jgi:DNA-binding response OmpR family regulator